MAEQTANIGALTNPEVHITALSDVAQTHSRQLSWQRLGTCAGTPFLHAVSQSAARRFAGICGLFRVRTLHESPEDALAFIART